jgi:hypothetical protein
MIILQRAIPYFAVVAVALLLYFGVAVPVDWPWYVAGLIAVPIGCVIVMRQRQWRLEYAGLSAPMIILLVATYSFMLIQERSDVIIVAGVIAVIYFGLFEKNVATFLFQPSKYIPYSLEHMSTYTTLVAAFFAYVSIFMFGVLHLVRLRYLLLAAILVTMLMVWQTFWIQKLPWQRVRWFVLGLTTVIVESMMVLYYWPISFFVNGALLTLIFYVTLHLSRHYLADTLTRRLIIRYSSLASLATVILLFSAKWIF